MTNNDEYLAVMVERLRIASELVCSAMGYNRETQVLGKSIIKSIEDMKVEIVTIFKADQS